MNIEVKKYFSEGRSGAGVPNRKGWQVIATSRNFRVTHTVNSVADAAYLERGSDGYSASTVVHADTFEYPPKPELPAEWRDALRQLLKALERGREAGIVKRGFNDLDLETAKFAVKVDHYAHISAQTLADGDPARYAHRLVAEALAEISRLLNWRKPGPRSANPRPAWALPD